MEWHELNEGRGSDRPEPTRAERIAGYAMQAVALALLAVLAYFGG